MEKYFQSKLFDLYDDLTDSGTNVPGDELKKIVSFGVRGEWGENYFLFIYRDFYRDPSYYGAVIFFNKRDQLGNPVTVIGIEQNGKEQVRNIYVKAALFFLKNEFQDTMTLSGNAAVVFNMAKDKINAFIGKAPLQARGEELDHFEFDIAHQEIQFQEIKPQKRDKKFKSRFLDDNLAKLQQKEKSEGEISEAGRLKANLGLSLISRHLDLSGERQNFFQPVIIPLKADGQTDKPQKPAKTGSTNQYEWAAASKLLEDFFTFFVYMESQPGNPGLKANLMNQVFFQRLAEEIFALPGDLIFCQVDNTKEYQPLKTLKFKKLSVRFAPSLEKEFVYRFFLTFSTTDGQSINARDDYEIILLKERVYIWFTSPGGEIWFAVPEDPESLDRFYRFFDFLAAQEKFYFHELDNILSALRSMESEYLAIEPEPLKKFELCFLPTPVLNIYPAYEHLNKHQRLELEFDYEGEMKKFIAQHPDKEVCMYLRDEKFERQCLEILKNDPLLSQQMDYHVERKTVFHYYYFRDNDLLKWLIERGRKYLEKGFKIYSVKWKRYIANAGSSIRFHITDGIDWLEFKPYIHDPLTGQNHEIRLEDIDTWNKQVIDKKGMLHLVTVEEIRKLTSLYRYAEQHGNWFRIPSKNYVLIRRLYDEKMEDIPGVKEILTTEERLREFERIPDYPLSSHFNGQLRNYQQHGFKWLYFLQDYRFSGCLADDMGLGKTVQALALLQTLKDNKKLNTSLLVVPVSAIPNWEAEMQRFTPALTYHRHMGANRDKDTRGWEEKDLIITSYATMRNDIDVFKDFEFDYIILDESQNIKNPSSQVSQAAKILKGRNRLALSGTPIENNTLELWSLFDFLMPGFLGTYRWFNRQWAQGIEKGDNPEKSELLKKMIYPFVMRRKKEEVETELPEKIEIVSKLQMEEEQLKVYGETARFYREKLDKEIDEKGVAGSSVKIFEGMLRLRQICLFPRLVDEKFDRVSSAKFDHFKELLEDILAEDHKVLVFSQFVRVLKIIRAYCDEEKFTYSYIDGSVNVNTREKMVKSFQEEEGNRVFLLSLKAGGVAINLTAADYVIIFDPWWNPAVEAQAIDRSHRIGQTKKVMVYRMVVKESIEEKMLALQERKKVLVENLIASDAQAFKNLKKEDILNLFN
ncbi:MAG: DEAD/DEAH box helicase [Candidatus Aminicenantes bacterium]|nr:MAG: DEAD/DEAH box helicase [Candidatus Aminicenantes bacterium]